MSNEEIAKACVRIGSTCHHIKGDDACEDCQQSAIKTALDSKDSVAQAKIAELMVVLEAENSTLRDERDHLKAGWASLEQLQADLATAQQTIELLSRLLAEKALGQ